jgi:hypothetical protein
MNVKKFENKFQSKICSMIPYMKFNRISSHIELFIAANLLFFLMINILITISCLYSILTYYYQYSAQSNIIFSLAIHGAPFLVFSYWTIKSEKITNDNLISSGYGNKQWFIFEIKDKERL